MYVGSVPSTVRGMYNVVANISERVQKSEKEKEKAGNNSVLRESTW